MTNDSVFLIRAIKPAVTGVIHRERLLAKLDEARLRPAVWVAGPGGAGKTTLVASYLDNRSLRSLWYQMDEGDSDPGNFFYNLAIAAQQAASPKKCRLPLFSPEYLHNLPVFTRTFFSALYQHFAPFLLVLDNYQNVAATSQFHEFLRDAIPAVPEGCSIIVVSRDEPLPQFARLLANDLLGVIAWDQIRFDLEEVRELIKCKGGAALSEPTLHRLQEKIGGWAAGLVIMVEALRRSPDGAAFLEGFTPEQLSDYFQTEVLEKVGAETAKFLVRTAYFPQMTIPLVEELTDSVQCRAILSGLARNNYFTTRHEGTREAYQYHQLFREFLRAKAQELLGPEELLAVKTKTAQVLEKAGLLEDAGKLYLVTGQWESLVAMALSNAPSLLTLGRAHLLEEWLSNLPDDITAGSPWILYWLGACATTRSFADARGYFEKAFPLFDAEEEVTGIYLTWAGVVESILYEWADFMRLDVWIEQLHRLMGRHPVFPSGDIEGRVASSMFGALMFHKPQDPDIDAWAERLETLTQGSNDPEHRIMVGNQLALYHLWWTGNHPKLAAIMDLLRPPGNGENLPPLARIIWCTLTGLQQWASGLSRQGQATFAKGMSIVDESGIHVFDFMLYFQGIVSYLDVGDYRTGDGYIRELFSRLDRKQKVNLAHCCYVAGWQSVLEGDMRRAQEHMQTAVEATENLGGPFTHAAVWAAWTQVQYLCGSRDDAFLHMEKSIQLARDIKAPLLVFRNLMTKAFFALDAGREELCLSTLREGLSLGRERLFMNHSWWLKPVMTKLCLKALEAGIEVAYVRELITRRELVPGEPPLHLERWPWPLKIRTFGGFALLKADVPVVFSRKVQKKPLEMLKALVALGGEESHKGQLADLLWPDVDGDTARNAFKVTLHRLRELLGNEKALQVREGCLVLERCLCWTDAWAFEKMITDAQLKREDGAEEEAACLIKKALDLYRGDFLREDTDLKWAVSPRKRLHNKFVLNLTAIGRFYQTKGDHKRAVACYLQGLEVDDLAEELYQNLMLCYLATGLRAEAINAYLRCKSNLAISLSVSPSAQTDAIYKSALN